MDFFLKTKHWVLFLLMYGFIIFIQFLPVYFFITDSLNHTYFESEKFVLDMLGIIMFFTIISVIVLFAWIYSISIGLQKLFPDDIKYNKKAFKIFFVSPIIFYFLLFVFILSLAGGGIEYYIEANPFIFIIIVFLVIMPLSFYSAFCQIFLTIYAAKSYKTALLQRKVTFRDFVGEFFLIYFSMVGVWVLQPKINRMYKKIAQEKQNY